MTLAFSMIILIVFTVLASFNYFKILKSNEDQILNFIKRDIDQVTRLLKYNSYNEDIISEIISTNDAFTYFKISTNDNAKELFFYEKNAKSEYGPEEIQHYTLSKHGYVIEIKTELSGLHNDTISNFLDYIPFYTLVIFFAVILIYYTSDYLSSSVRYLANLFKGVLHHAPMGIIIRDQNGEITETSHYFNRIFQYRHLTEKMNSNYEPVWNTAFFEIQNNLDKRVSVFKKDYQFVSKEKELNFTTISFSLANNPRNKYYCTLAINTSDEKRFKRKLEKKSVKAKRANDAKTNFLATMSHEIRTPLTSIVGFLNILKDTDLTTEQQKYVGTASSSSENLMSLINDILDYSKIESNDFSLEESQFSLKSLIIEIQSIFEHMAKEKGISFEVNYDDRVFGSVISDQVRLRQIIVNLLGNAIKFTSKGRVVLNIERISEKETSQVLRISVEDTGIGLKPDQLQGIFDQFSQADNTISRKFGGTGLGLSISKKISDLMNGSLSVDSIYGEGSVFTYELETAKGDPIEETPKNIDSENAQQYNKKNVLIVDDEESNQLIIQIYMKKLGIDPMFADNGKEAVDLYKKNLGEIDLILMDIQMPEMDGVEALKKIRNIEQGHQLEPVTTIAFTANVFKEQLDEYHAHGFNDHLMKPFKKSDVLNIVKRYLN